MNSRLNWTKEEEQLLRDLGSNEKKNKWTIIAKMLNQKSTSFKRTPKQCRQKFNNHLIFGQNQVDSNWTALDDKLLFKLYSQNGSKWKIISKSFPNKSQNTIKNKFYGSIRKVVRKLNKIGKQSIKKSLKPIRQKSFLRIIESENIISELPEIVLANLKQLRAKLLQLIEQQILEQYEQNSIFRGMAIEAIKQVHHFNSNYRFYFGKKAKKNVKEKINNENSQYKVYLKNPHNNSQNQSSQNIDSFSDQQAQKQFASGELAEQDLKNSIQQDKQTHSTTHSQKTDISTQQGTVKKTNNIVKKSTFIQQIVQLVYQYCLDHDKSYLLLFDNKIPVGAEKEYIKF